MLERRSGVEGGGGGGIRTFRCNLEPVTDIGIQDRR